jgi:hypothetical protein
MNSLIKRKAIDAGIALLAILVGASVVFFGDKLLGITLELYYGIETFSPLWVVDLFFVPFVAGIVVSLIYGLGGKILAHFSPLLVRVISYYEFNNGPVNLGDSIVMPMSYWLLIVIVSVEFSSIGGVVGEVIVKRTYGRSAKHLIHKKYKKEGADDGATPAPKETEL